MIYKFPEAFIPMREGKEPYKILKYLSHGGSANVCLGENTKTKEQVALKVNSSSQLSDPTYRKYLLSEIGILHSLKDTDNVVQLKDFFEDVKTHDVIIVEEYCTEGDLKKFNSTNYPNYITDGTQCALIFQLAVAIANLHKIGIIHRDIKEENIMLTRRDGQLTLIVIDFGISKKFVGNDIGYTEIGTLSYMAPEMKEGKSHNKKVDTWSFGILLHKMTFCCFPTEIPKDRKFKLSPDNPSLPAGLYDLISGCLNVSVGQRFSMDQILAHRYFDKVCYIEKLPINDWPEIQENLYQIRKDITPSKATYKLLEAKNIKNSRIVFIKQFDSGDKKRALNEVVLLKRLEHIPNIIKLEEHGKYKEKYTLVFSGFEYQTLKDFVSKAVINQYSDHYIFELIKIAYKICLSLSEIASANVIIDTLDVPSIFLRMDEKVIDQPILLGFQDSIKGIESENKPYALSYSLSLERFRPDVFTSKTDVWSFGILLYKMFCNPKPALIKNIFTKATIEMPHPLYFPKKIQEIICQCCIQDEQSRIEIHSIAKDPGFEKLTQ